MKVGIVGLGYMGAAHARVYRRIEGCELVGICDADSGKKSLADTYQTTFFSDYNELFREGLDAVSICTPTVSHAEIANSAFECGCHVLVEKPFAFDVEEAYGVLKKAQGSGRLLGVGYIERFNPAIRKLKELLDVSEIFSTVSLRFGPGGPRIKDIGVLMDLGSHEVDLLNYVMGVRPKVLSSQFSFSSNGRFEDYAYVSLSYGHVHSHMETSWLPQYKKRHLSVYGNERFFALDYAQQTLKSCRAPPKVQVEHVSWQDFLWMSRNIEEEIPVTPGEPLNLELLCFLESIRKGELVEPLCDGCAAIDVLEIVDEAKAVSERRF